MENPKIENQLQKTQGKTEKTMYNQDKIEKASNASKVSKACCCYATTT